MSHPPSASRRACLRLLLGAGLGACGTRVGAQDKPAADTERRAIFLDVERIVVSVFRGSEVDRHEMLLMKLELSDETAIVPVQRAMPRLRDAFIKGWNGLGTRPDAAEKGLDVVAGRARMIAAADRIVGPGRVRNVLIVGQSSRAVGPRRR
jgi:hypothetical protein